MHILLIFAMNTAFLVTYLLKYFNVSTLKELFEYVDKHNIIDFIKQLAFIIIYDISYYLYILLFLFISASLDFTSPFYHCYCHLI